MKLTKQKLEQLITEEFKSMSRRIFDKRRQAQQGPGIARTVGDFDQPRNYPEYADKLTRLAKDDYAQAKELATALGEPLDVEIDTSNPETFKIPKTPDGYFGVDGPYFTHARMVMWANANGYPQLKFIDEIIPEAVKAFANAEGMDYEETLSAVNTSLSNLKSSQMKKHTAKFDPNQQMADVHGFDQDPFGYDPFEED